MRLYGDGDLDAWSAEAAGRKTAWYALLNAGQSDVLEWLVSHAGNRNRRREVAHDLLLETFDAGKDGTSDNTFVSDQLLETLAAGMP